MALVVGAPEAAAAAAAAGPPEKKRRDVDAPLAASEDGCTEDEALLDEALHHELDELSKPSKSEAQCARCTKNVPAEQFESCKSCAVPYCSSECLTSDAKEHAKRCKRKGRQPTPWDTGGETQAKRVSSGLEKCCTIPRALFSDFTRHGASHVLLSIDASGRFIVQGLGGGKAWLERNTGALADFIQHAAPTREIIEQRRAIPLEERATYRVRLPEGCTDVSVKRIEGTGARHYADYYLRGYVPNASAVNEANTPAGRAECPVGTAQNQPTYPTHFTLPAIGNGPHTELSHARRFFDEKEGGAAVQLWEELHREQRRAAAALGKDYGPPSASSAKRAAPVKLPPPTPLPLAPASAPAKKRAAAKNARAPAASKKRATEAPPAAAAVPVVAVAAPPPAPVDPGTQFIKNVISAWRACHLPAIREVREALATVSTFVYVSHVRAPADPAL